MTCTQGTICQLLFFNGKVISCDPPMFMDLEISECPPNVKGNTASGMRVDTHRITNKGIQTYRLLYKSSHA